MKQSQIIHPDGTIFFRTDRQLWIAMLNGKQEAARKTVEKCRNFLTNKKFAGEIIVLEKQEI